MTDSGFGDAETGCLRNNAAASAAVSTRALRLARLSRDVAVLLRPSDEGENVRKTSTAGMTLPSLTTPWLGLAACADRAWASVAIISADNETAPRTPTIAIRLRMRLSSRSAESCQLDLSLQGTLRLDSKACRRRYFIRHSPDGADADVFLPTSFA